MDPTAELSEDARFQTDDSMSTKQQPRQQLSKAMEHMRFAVTADPVPRFSATTNPPVTSNATPQTQAQAESDAYGVPAAYAPVRKPTHRSHSPTNNQKRTDPFAFGSRFLEEGDDIFEFNAWDHVDVDASYLEFSAQQFEKQKADPVSEFDRKRFNDHPEKWWNLFYKNNKTNFFKNRKWLAQEFPILDEVTKEDAPPTVLLEVGAGAGNSAFPILQKRKNPGLKIHACDFSKKAVELIRSHELYNPKYIQADVWDVAASLDSENAGLPPGLQESSVDVVLMIFIFSALNPRQWDQAVQNIWRVLKPGGQVLFRDYGRGDLAQVRFKKGRYMEENFYVRGDGTRVYFFEKQELEHIWGGKDLQPGTNGQDTIDEKPSDKNDQTAVNFSSNDNDTPHKDSQQGSEMNKDPRPVFDIVHFGIDRRMLVNRQRRLKMYRCWMQAVFRKAGDQSQVATSTIRQDKQAAEEGKEGRDV
jgi:tRNAThr (cytosine32-N3)-methyltransferase